MDRAVVGRAVGNPNLTISNGGLFLAKNKIKKVRVKGKVLFPFVAFTTVRRKPSVIEISWLGQQVVFCFGALFARYPPACENVANIKGIVVNRISIKVVSVPFVPRYVQQS